MNHATLALLSGVAMMASLLSESVADTAITSWQGYYESQDDQTLVPGKTAEVDVFPAYEGQAAYIDFEVSASLPQQSFGAASAIYGLDKERFSFSFKDAWGNDGRGTFSRHGKNFVLHLESVRESSSGETLSQIYGDYDLVRKTRNGRSDRHQWSPGNKQ